MDEPDDTNSQPPESQNSLPDVVHSQQIPASETVINESPSINLSGESCKNAEKSLSETDSISEHIPSNIDYSLSEIDAPKVLSVEKDVHYAVVPQSDINLEQSERTSSTLIDPKISDLRDESPIPLPLSSDASKDTIDQSYKEDTSQHDSQIHSDSSCHVVVSNEQEKHSSTQDMSHKTTSHAEDKSEHPTDAKRLGQEAKSRDTEYETQLQSLDSSHDETPSHKHDTSELEITQSHAKDTILQSKSLTIESEVQSENESCVDDESLQPPIVCEIENVSEHESNSHVEEVSHESQSRESKYSDSLNKSESHKSENINVESEKICEQITSMQDVEEVIILDIRGHASLNQPILPYSEIIEGLPPEGATIEPPINIFSPRCSEVFLTEDNNLINITDFGGFENFQKNLEEVDYILSVENNMKRMHQVPIEESGVIIEEIFDEPLQIKDTPQVLINEGIQLAEESKLLSPTLIKKLNSPKTDKIEQSDLLVEEITVENSKIQTEEEQVQTTPKSLAHEEQSLSTLTEYKTFDEYSLKLVHLGEAIADRNNVIEELSISLQQVKAERDRLVNENKCLNNNLFMLQAIEEKGQLSDFVKYETMKDDSTRFYSALMSSHSSLSSKGEQKDYENEEITINHSRSDLRSSDESDELDPKAKLTHMLSQLALEENMRNTIMEEVTQLVIDEACRVRFDCETENRGVKQELEKKNSECSKLRELLENVKSDNPNVNALRNELHIKYEKEVENLRIYFEKKCTDMERSYSEEVLRGRSAVSPGGAGDFRRTRSVELSNFDECQEVAKLRQKYEQQIEDMERNYTEKILHLESAIADLKVKLQTPVDTEIYQDIDLELEKKTREQARQDTVDQLLNQMQVLLSAPDSETTNWPVELVTLRDKIYTDASRQSAHEYSSVREEWPSDSDKRKARRNLCFDQNRQLEDVTKDIDELKVVAQKLEVSVSQLVDYCVAPDDELNITVIPELLSQIIVSTPQSSRHVHFAPRLSNLSESDLRAAATPRDSIDIKRDLDFSLLRLRKEAQKLLAISKRIDSSSPVEGSPRSEMKIKELPCEIQAMCENCVTYKKDMAECVHRENLLRNELSTYKKQIAELMMQEEHTDVIAEGYGCVSPRPRSLPSRRPDVSPSNNSSSPSPREREIDALVRERDDLLQQLESANRQLKAKRQFIEEQTTEREQERDDYTKTINLLREEKANITTLLHKKTKIVGEIEDLEAQTRDMTTIIQELETKKLESDRELRGFAEEIKLQHDIILTLEQQLEQKVNHENEILSELEKMKATIDERDIRVRALLGELESMRSERVEYSDVSCAKCNTRDEEHYEADDMELVKEQVLQIESWIHGRCVSMEHVHEVCSTSCSEHTEDVSFKDQHKSLEESSPVHLSEAKCTPLLRGIWQQLVTLSRAEDAAVKRIRDLEMQRAQLNNIAQEIRCERDVLQSRMSEQALNLAALKVRLDSQRQRAAIDTQHATASVTGELHDALTQVQRLTDELDAKEKQLMILKQSIEEKDKLNEERVLLFANTCNPKDKVIILERSFEEAQKRIAQLEETCSELQTAKVLLKEQLKNKDKELAERENQLKELLVLNLDEDKTEQKSEVNEGKHSARTLSDIVSISDYDEEDLQMRRAELKHNYSLHSFNNNNKTIFNASLPPDVTEKHQITSLPDPLPDNMKQTPRADSLPVNLSKQYPRNYKRNHNETTVLGSVDRFGEHVQHSTAHKVPDNSMYPNKDISVDKNVTFEPRRINFSLEPSHDNRTRDEELSCLKELGVIMEVNTENLPDILSQMKQELIKYKTELENCKSEMKQAEEHLCEFPALKEEVEELKTSLETTIATMENDKKYYNNQLEHFKSNKTLLEQRLTDLTQEITKKSEELHLLKEDILQRENVCLELAKEKRNLTNKNAELEIRLDELQSRNNVLTKCEADNKQLKEKLNDLHKLEQLVSEKNQQIDSLNQHLDQVDDLQRCLFDKNEQLDNLKDQLVEKSTEITQLQDTVDALKHDIANSNEENSQLIIANKDLKHKLTKVEKEHENSTFRLQSNEVEVSRLSSINKELSNKIEELKQVTFKLKDKECEIEMLNEDINAFHEEIANLKEQLKMVSRSPSPRKVEDKTVRGRSNDDRKQLDRIRKQISMLQHELDFQKKELNDQAFELAKSKLDVTELTNTISLNSKQLFEKDLLITSLTQERDILQRKMHELEEDADNVKQQLELVTRQLREECGGNELKQKLKEKTDECRRLELEIERLKNNLETEIPGNMLVASGSRSPTAELEHALRTQLDYSHQLDEDIIEQILSSSSDVEEIPPLALNSSKSSSIYSSSSERISRLRSERDRLQLQFNSLEERLQDKDALIMELKSVRDSLKSECDKVREEHAIERENCMRLQLLLDAHKHTADTLQSQDAHMISILNKRLESAMNNELNMQQRLANAITCTGSQEHVALEQARAEITSLQRKLELEKTSHSEMMSKSQLEYNKLQAQLCANSELLNSARRDLAQVIRQKQDCLSELSRCKQLIETQSDTIKQLQAKLHSPRKEKLSQALNEFESHKCELTREISTLKQCLEVYQSAHSPRDMQTEVARLMNDKRQLEARLRHLEDNTQTTEKDTAMRYLHSRCLRLESCRKALVWQKKYLQRALSGYKELELHVIGIQHTPRPTGKKLFKTVALCVIITCRMRYLVQRRVATRVVTNNILISQTQNTPVTSRVVPSSMDTVYRSVSRSQLFTLHSPHRTQRDDLLQFSTPRRVRENTTYLHNMH